MLLEESVLVVNLVRGVVCLCQGCRGSGVMVVSVAGVTSGVLVVSVVAGVVSRWLVLLQEWIIGGITMATSSTLCGPCSERHITKPSVHWCSECEVSICDDCQELHNVLKATRSHEFIPIAKYESLSSFITDIQQSCNYHNEKYQQYCVAHALPICFKCSKEHQKCNVIPLDEVTNNAKTSGHFQDLETRLIDLLHNIDIIKKDRKANLVSIAERKEIHLEEIQHIRNQINEQLDKLEKDIKQDIEKNICQCKQSIQSILLTVKEKENLIIEYQTTLQLTKQHASDLQTFLVMRDIKVKVLENEQYLQSLVETNKFETVDLVFKVYPEVNSILNSMKLFGSIEIKKKSSIICLIRADDRQAQLQVTPARTINDLKLILKKKITTDGEHITSCCMSVKGEYFFTDYYSKKLLSVTASDGTFKFNILLDPSYRFDITLIDEKTIAITSGDYDKHKGIDIINTESRKKIKFISLPGCAWGITRDQDALFVCVETRGIYTVRNWWLVFTFFRGVDCWRLELSYNFEESGVVLKKGGSCILQKFNQIKNQKNDHLDKLKKEIKQDLEKKACLCEKNIQKILSSGEEKKNFITEYQTNLKSIKQHGANLQTFLVVRDIEMKVFENEKYLQSLVESNKFDTVDLICKVDTRLRSISNSLKTFGSIKIKTTWSTICLFRAKHKQVQLQTKSTRTISDL
ncbi:Hypothetical predicted protein [Mytilus galloprovincialis]|uniref:B box-type domain-containing protein n=1 Tax=Mytilus galloprovincialis TaxID=29158 RepID=A0A8B6D445_MYTGA|nr:Hypothetical predicted protein [Mytilus galloprovincialis]